MLRHTLIGLFGTAVEGDLLAATALTIDEILRLTDATDEVRKERWGARFAITQAAVLAARTMGENDQSHADGTSLGELHRATYRDAADAGTITSADLARRSGLTEDKSNAFLTLFSLDCSELEPAAAVRNLLRGASPLRTRPIVVDGTGRAVACHAALLIGAIRPRLEEALKAAGAESKYYKHRGDFIEAEAVQLLGDALSSPASHAGFEYFEPNPEASGVADEVRRGPGAYTKLVEGDGLMIVDDIAIVIESKAVNISGGTRQGALGGMRRNLTEVVSKVVAQAHRMRTRIENDRGLRLRDGKWVDLSHVREIHSIAVTMEDLSGVATVTADLVDAGLVDPQSLPWLVSIHDLRIITELVERPAELLLFLRRRTQPEVTRKFWAIDELDFFLHFQSTGLYVEPDPDVVADALPHMPPPTTADQRRFANQGREFLTSRTGPLDDWYFYQLGIRESPAAKPSLAAAEPLLQLIDAISGSGRPGWASTVALILECSAEGRADLVSRAATVVDRVRLDGRPHTAPSPLGTSRETLTVLTMASAAAPLSTEDRTFLTRFTRAKKHQVHAAVGATVVLGPDREVLDLIYQADPYGPDPELDRLVDDMKLAPLVASRPVPPRPRRRGVQRLKKRR